MKTLIQIVLVALIVGGVSAGGSYYWHQVQAKLAMAAEQAESAASDEVTDEENEEISDSTKEIDFSHRDTIDVTSEPMLSDDETGEPTPFADSKPEILELNTQPLVFGPPAGIRPPFDANADEAGDLINKLRARAAVTSRQERRMAEREDAMTLIVEDLRVEQANSAKMRKRILEETNRSLRTAEETQRATANERAALYRAAQMERTRMREEQAEERRLADEQVENIRREKEEALQSAENAMKTARDEQEELRKQLEESRNPKEIPDRSGSPEETANLKKSISIFDSMPVESTAKALQEFVDKGQTEAVVAILNGLKPKKAADVLALIQDTHPSLVADLLQRLKRYKKEVDSKPDAAK
jgi:hypothetical protein